MKNIAPDDEKAANVRHNDVENYAKYGFALKNAKKNDELKSKIANEEYENQIYSFPIKLRTGSKLEKTDLCQEG